MKNSTAPAPISRLAKLVNKPGGMTEAEAVAAATINMNEIRDRTLDEITGTIDQIERIAESLENGTDAAERKRLYALSNSVMGVAGAFGMSGLSAVAYSLCELIDRLQMSGTWSARSVRIHVDSMRLMGKPDIDEDESLKIKTALRTLVDRVPSAPA